MSGSQSTWVDIWQLGESIETNSQLQDLKHQTILQTQMLSDQFAQHQRRLDRDKADAKMEKQQLLERKQMLFDARSDSEAVMNQPDAPTILKYETLLNCAEQMQRINERDFESFEDKTFIRGTRQYIDTNMQLLRQDFSDYVLVDLKHLTREQSRVVMAAFVNSAFEKAADKAAENIQLIRKHRSIAWLWLVWLAGIPFLFMSWAFSLFVIVALIVFTGVISSRRNQRVAGYRKAIREAVESAIEMQDFMLGHDTIYRSDVIREWIIKKWGVDGCKKLIKETFDEYQSWFSDTVDQERRILNQASGHALPHNWTPLDGVDLTNEKGIGIALDQVLDRKNLVDDMLKERHPGY